MFVDIATYCGLFVSAFFSATLIPASSEIVLVGLLIADNQPVWALLTVATAGNILGSSTNWLLGRFFYGLRHHRWFPVKEASMDKAVAWYRKYGLWSLLLSWAPIIGDPLTLIAGVLRVPFTPFFCIVLVAKFVRYLVVAGLTLHLID
jgi:membrane protein YqaA with SNARE-associated domain